MQKRIIILLFLIFILQSSVVVFADSTISVDSKTGIAIIKADVNNKGPLMVLIEKGSERYQYPITPGKDIYLPLQMGNGDYKIRITEKIAEYTYKQIKEYKHTLKLEDNNVVYLTSILEVNWNKDQELIKKAAEITKGLKTNESKIKAIHGYVSKNFSYDYDKASTVSFGYIPELSTLYTSKKGICYDYASIFAAMSRSVGIPTKLVKGYGTITGKTYHAWNEVLLDGKWKIIDTTIDAPLVQSKKTVSVFKNTKDYKVSRYY